jgi:hypothetical protein
MAELRIGPTDDELSVSVRCECCGAKPGEPCRPIRGQRWDKGASPETMAAGKTVHYDRWAWYVGH